MRVPVSVRIRRGCSPKRRVFAGIGQRAKMPRPPFAEVRTSIRVPIVSGRRRGCSSKKLSDWNDSSEAETSFAFGLDDAVVVDDNGVVTPILGFGDTCAMILSGSERE